MGLGGCRQHRVGVVTYSVAPFRLGAPSGGQFDVILGIGESFGRLCPLPVLLPASSLPPVGDPFQEAFCPGALGAQNGQSGDDEQDTLEHGEEETDDSEYQKGPAGGESDEPP